MYKSFLNKSVSTLNFEASKHELAKIQKKPLRNIERKIKKHQSYKFTPSIFESIYNFLDNDAIQEES